jgi:hypothetical protein
VSVIVKKVLTLQNVLNSNEISRIHHVNGGGGGGELHYFNFIIIINTHM